MRVYAPTKTNAIGGGWSFHQNLRKALEHKVQFVSSWEDCDVFLITGITITDPNEVREAHRRGKRIVLRVDNVPRKSRNRRSSPHERLAEFAKLADTVIYQSQWAKEYCFPLCGEGTIIYNGVNQKIFKPDEEEMKGDDREYRYLYMYHGKNELKQFWKAHLLFQYIHRKNPEAVFWFVNDFGSDTNELQNSNFDFWNGETFHHLPKQESMEDVAELMQQCKYLIYPSISDASPNTVLEARACGMEIVGASEKEYSGTQELIELEDISVERMAEEYYGVFDLLINS